MADFINVSKDAVSVLLKAMKAIYAPIPEKLNRNKEAVSAKAIYVETENKYAIFLSCEYCNKMFAWYKCNDGKCMD